MCGNVIVQIDVNQFDKLVFANIIEV